MDVEKFQRFTCCGKGLHNHCADQLNEVKSKNIREYCPLCRTKRATTFDIENRRIGYNTNEAPGVRLQVGTLLWVDWPIVTKKGKKATHCLTSPHGLVTTSNYLLKSSLFQVLSLLLLQYFFLLLYQQCVELLLQREVLLLWLSVLLLLWLSVLLLLLLQQVLLQFWL